MSDSERAHMANRMDRRSLVKKGLVGIVAGVALTGPPGARASAGPSLGDRGPYRTWPGTYEGRNDGRRARLTVSVNQVGGTTAWYDVVLQDLDRNRRFVGSGAVQYTGNQRHVMQFPDPLQDADGGDPKQVGRLLLHGSDIDYISGYTTWQGRDFGLYFERV